MQLLEDDEIEDQINVEGNQDNLQGWKDHVRQCTSDLGI